MYRKFLLGLIVCASGGFCFAAIDDDPRIILRRGDANSDGKVDLSDVSFIDGYLFDGGPEPPCMNQADANDDGAVDGADSSYLLYFLFYGGPPPPSPGPYNTECTTDDTYWISCEVPPCSLES